MIAPFSFSLYMYYQAPTQELLSTNSYIYRAKKTSSFVLQPWYTNTKILEALIIIVYTWILNGCVYILYIYICTFIYCSTNLYIDVWCFCLCSYEKYMYHLQISVHLPKIHRCKSVNAIGITLVQCSLQNFMKYIPGLERLTEPVQCLEVRYLTVSIISTMFNSFRISHFINYFG